MSKHCYLRLIRLIVAIWVLAAVGLVASACGGDKSALNPQSPEAETISNFWWLLLGLGTVTFIGVFAFLILALFRRRPDDLDLRAPGPTSAVLLFGAAFPAIVIVLLMGLMLDVLGSDDSTEDELVIQVDGRQWWWEVTYPGYGFETANEIHVPVGQVVRLELTSSDVIHSFWVPSMAGKVDAIPGQTNELRFRVKETGVYSGQCAEFCGIQHANMRILIIAEDDFETWAQEQQQPMQSPVEDRLVAGQEIFFSSSCVYCHAIRGTSASGDIGPDLTHLASRRTIGAGVLTNNAGTLSGWVLNPHQSKPGNLMPASDLDAETLVELVQFLNSLE